MKAAVYCGTRNLYPAMVTAAKSLTKNSSVEEIWFLIEDPVFPEELPEYIHCIDVSGQTIFNKNGPNVYKLWTWMVLMRAALTKFFPDYDRILSLDVDTIVDDNIDELWNMDLDEYFFAGAPEPKKSLPNVPYINMGVVMFNLKKLRTEMMDDRVIYLLNHTKYRFAEQDCMNQLCYKQVRQISCIYNKNEFTGPCGNPKIHHFACDKKWIEKPLYQKYAAMSWNEVRRSV